MKTYAIEIIDFFPRMVDDLGDGNGWGVYDVKAKMSDGTVRAGFCQGDTYNWALETFESEEE